MKKIVKLLIIINLVSIINCQNNYNINGLPWKFHVIDSNLYGADGIKLGYFNNDSLIDFISGGEEYGATRVYLNQGELNFNFLEFPSPDVEDAIFEDINNDGYKEILTFSEGNTQKIDIHFINDKKNNWVSKTIPATKGKKWMYGIVADLDNKNGLDIIVGAKGENAILGWLETTEDINGYEKWKLHKIASVGWIMSIEYIDLDNDGNKDILVSDRKGKKSGIKWFKNPGKYSDKFKQEWDETIIGLKNKKPMFLCISDYNKDGLDDIIVAEAVDGIYYLEKIDKSGHSWNERLLFNYPIFAGDRGKSVACIDIDNDMNYEIISSYEMAQDKYGVIYSKYNVTAKKWDHYAISSKKGIKYDKILPFDIDRDGDIDILITEEKENTKGLGVIWYENNNKSISF